MIKIKTAFALIAALSVILTGATLAAEVKTYKAVGTLLRATDTMLLLRTSAQDLEITRDAKTKVHGEIRRGASATVIYTKVTGNPYATEVTIGSGTGAHATKR